MIQEIIMRAGYSVKLSATLPAEVPALPTTYIPREAFNTLKALLVDGDSEAVVLKALGMGGSGKTVLATALARDAEVMGSFWRVLWINVGE